MGVKKMANVTLNAKIVSKNDTRTNWASKNPILLKGEIGVEFDGSAVKFKIGDGVKTWNDLTYASNSEEMIISIDSVTGAGTAAKADIGFQSGQVPVLDALGKLNSSTIPQIAITDIFTVASQAEMLAVSGAHRGDIAIRTDIDRTFILTADSASALENWVELKTPTDAVISVNAKTGAVVLNTDDVEEGVRQYFTEERATANFNSNFASKSSADLTDGSELLKTTDTIIINGGQA